MYKLLEVTKQTSNMFAKFCLTSTGLFVFSFVLSYLHSRGYHFARVLPHSYDLIVILLILAIVFPLLFLIREIILICMAIVAIDIYEWKFTPKMINEKVSKEIQELITG